MTEAGLSKALLHPPRCFSSCVSIPPHPDYERMTSSVLILSDLSLSRTLWLACRGYRCLECFDGPLFVVPMLSFAELQQQQEVNASLFLR